MNSLLRMLFKRIAASETSEDDNDPAAQEDGNVITWGPVELPLSEATGHLMAAGTTGSGKTTILRLFMQSVLPQIVAGSDRRALIYDAKGDLMSLLPAICPEADIKTMHPFDSRGVAWAAYRDIQEPLVAIETVFTLIPQQQESQPFFSDAARHLMYGVIISYIRSGVEWTFADLLRGLMSPMRLKAILRKHPETRPLIHRYFSDRRLLSNIMSTIATKMLPFEPIFAAWDDAREKVSLEAWSRSEGILLLGNCETSRTAIDAINRCIFKRACDITLAQQETLTPRTWFIIDELSEAGRLDGLVSLLKKGRSKGASVTISFQSVSGLRDARMYGPHFTDEILGQIGNRFFGRLECPETADWVSKLFGDQEIDQITISNTSSSQGGSTTRNHQIVTRRAVLPSDFMTVTPCDKENGLTGYFLIRSLGCFQATMPGEALFNEALIPADKDVREFSPRPIEAQYLRPWTNEEKRQFGIERSANSRKRPKHKQASDLKLDDLDEMDNL